MLTPAVCARHHVAGCAEPAGHRNRATTVLAPGTSVPYSARCTWNCRDRSYSKNNRSPDRRMTENQLACQHGSAVSKVASKSTRGPLPSSTSPTVTHHAHVDSATDVGLLLDKVLNLVPTLWTAFLPAPITELSIDWTSAMGEPLVFDLDAPLVFLEIRCCPSASAPASLRAQSRTVSGTGWRGGAQIFVPEHAPQTGSHDVEDQSSELELGGQGQHVGSQPRADQPVGAVQPPPARHTPRYGAVSTMRRPSSLAGCVAIGYRAANAVAPVSTGYPFCTMVSTRPPARGAASKTSTSQPVRAAGTVAAVRPAIPAPATTARRDFTIDGRDTLWLCRVSCWRLF